MTALFKKLNLKGQGEILVLNTPASYEPELSSLEGIVVRRSLDEIHHIEFSLAFVMTQEEIKTLAQAISEKSPGDPTIWFAYPKASSRKYRCDFNRDTGWSPLGERGFEGVRQVAIDEDWSALRFRRVEFIRTMRRDPKRAITAQGKKKTAH